MNDEEYMKMAIELAKKGAGFVNPNPMVGAVIVKNDRILATGYHTHFGGLHAEREAFKHCKESCQGATLYVTLEPCCHYGKTPPCTEAIIENGISKVVVGCLDKNPLVAGKGVSILRSHNIEVVTGVLEAECERLNKIFNHFIINHRPYVLMKYAMTMDGKIATVTGDSKWITNEKSRQLVQQLRKEYAAIMVGVNTVILDDPLLTCRLPHSKNPVRIVCDTKLRTPLASQLVQTANDVPTYIATCCEDGGKHSSYIEYGCHILVVPKYDGHVDLRALMEELGRMDIDSVLIEGGGQLNWSALKQQIVDEVDCFIGPKLFGGNGKSPVSGKGVDFVSEAIGLRPISMGRIGDDFLIESEVEYSCLPES